MRHKKSHHRNRTEIRIRKTGDKPTREEMRNAWESLRDTHRLPKGWKVAIIEWTHSQEGSRGWIEGKVSDLSDLETLINYLEENDDIRIGIDREKSKPEKGIWEILISWKY